MRLSKSTVVVGIIVLMLSLCYTTWLHSRRTPVYTVDLGKIARAQMLFAGRVAQSGHTKAWMQSINEMGATLKSTITALSKGGLVIVTPAVIAGGVDITDKVLVRLGLPTHIPRLHVPRTAVLPALLPTPAAPTTPKAPAWTLP